jgi:hypothetical protein
MSNKKLAGLSAKDLPPGLASRARRVLAADITRLEQFAKISEVDLLKQHSMGLKGHANDPGGHNTMRPGLCARR